MRKINRLAAVIAIFGLLMGSLEPALAGGKKQKQSEVLYAQGAEAEISQKYDVALGFYEKALAADPTNISYRLATIRVRFEASQKLVETGMNLRQQGKFQEALAMFQKAFAVDPASTIADQEMRRTYQMMERQKNAAKDDAAAKPENAGLTPAEFAKQEALKRSASMLSVPELKPLSRQVTSLKMVNQPPRVLYETLGKLTGINVLFDSEYQDQSKRFSIDLSNTTLDEALDYVALLTKTYWKPLSANAIFVTNDNATKRRDYEEHVTRIFYLQNLTSTQELQEVMTAMRTVTDVRKVFPVNSQSAIVVRGTADQVALAEKVLYDLDKPKSEVVVDVMVMEANKDKTRDIALTPMYTGKPGIGASIAFTPRNDPTLGTGTGTGAGSGSSTSGNGVIRLGSVASLNANDWSVVLPGALLQALAKDSTTKVMTTPQVRATDGQKASLRLGDRYPYATGSFQPGVGTVGVSPLVSTQFQFADIGINVDVTPRIHGTDEVSMQIELEISNIADRIDVGGLTQPVIGQRKISHVIRVREGEVTLIGGLMQATNSKTKSGVPGLMNLPFIGKLFTSDSIENKNAELVVALIPHIVRAPEITPESLRPIATGTDTIWKINYAPLKETSPAPVQQPKPPMPGALKSIPGVQTPGVQPASPAPPQRPPEAAPVQQAAPQNPESPGLARPSAVAGGPTLVLIPSAQELAPGGSLTVNVQLDEVTDLFAAPMKIKYDNKVLKLVEVTRGGFLTSDGQQATFSETKVEDPGGAVISMNRIAGAGGISGSGVLVTLKFQAVGKGTSTISFDEAALRDARLQDIQVALPSIAVTVK
jgi:general secretion pathway protein D